MTGADRDSPESRVPEAGPRREPKPSVFRRFGWLGVLAVPVAGAAVGVGLYGAATDWYFLLPGLPPFDVFLKDPSTLEPLAGALHVPPPPRDLDTETAWRFHEQYGRLRRAPANADEVGQLGELFEAQGHRDQAARCYRRAIELHPPTDCWHRRLARLLSAQGAAEEAAQLLRAADQLPDCPGPEASTS